MNTSKINATVIALLSSIAFLSGCGDEQKETSKQTNQTISESTPASPVSEAVDTATEMADQSGKAVKNVAEQAADKTAETAQDLMSTTKTATTTVKKAVSHATAVVKTTPEQVRKIQKALLQAGFNPGPADGVIGPKTMAALENFQKQKNLATGQITKETLQALDMEN